MNGASDFACRFEIFVLTGLHAGARLVLDGRRHTVIGRDLACDLTLRDTSVADRHLMLVERDGKIRAMGLDGAIEVNGLPVPDGKERLLRRGERVKLGDVSLGLGEPGAAWDGAQADEPKLARSRLSRWRDRIMHWIAQDEKRRRAAAGSIIVLAALCACLPLMVVLAQWKKRNEVVMPDTVQMAQQIGRRLASMDMRGLQVFADPTRHVVVIEGYLPRDEDVRRAEKVAISMKVRPTLRLHSNERIERQARDYVQRSVPEAVVEAGGMGEVRVASPAALQPRFQAWLRDQMLRDITGLRAVTFSGPDYNRTQELPPQPFSILSIGTTRFLLAKDGERLFPGAELPKGLVLVRIGQGSIFVERHGAADDGI
ncbi:phosphopeptide-binding protein [Burkholderia mayonis]|uniref:Phosphopeptide-binding protein n=1 Tax=Burkholderia mayonis TaxID=1385591 RepID=A0A1B4FJ62_9BURK|nr:FHA domain-containing protein [Burkholderia mayonis]AOJ03731.1 phosphopeptide-binding protein [Burkholderia mayonis]KVE46899.1 phosphopeptide-binding protein [Burkholderia mayonis]